MQTRTISIVLRTTAYGETSLISTQFVRESGMESFMHKGIRKSKTHRSSLLQPGQMLDLVIDRKPQNQWAYIREMSAHQIWVSIPSQIIKSSLVIFLSEFTLRLLPYRSEMADLFDFQARLLQIIEHSPASQLANLPLFLMRETSHILGIGIQGFQSPETPYFHLEEGRFSPDSGAFHPGWNEKEDLPFLSQLLRAESWEEVQHLGSDSRQRHRLLEGYLAYISYHTEHMGPIKSLDILRQIWKDN